MSHKSIDSLKYTCSSIVLAFLESKTNHRYDRKIKEYILS